jgi:hypothetical protein
MQFRTILAGLVLSSVATAIAVSQPESIEETKLTIREALAKFRRTEMVETGPVQLCADICVKGSREGETCDGDSSSGKEGCPGGQCEFLCD